MWRRLLNWIAQAEIEREIAAAREDERATIAAAVHDGGQKQMAYWIARGDLTTVRDMKHTDQQSTMRRWRKQKGITW